MAHIKAVAFPNVNWRYKGSGQSRVKLHAKLQLRIQRGLRLHGLELFCTLPTFIFYLALFAGMTMDTQK